MSMPGRFITFEGGEGAGKTTQIELLAAMLNRHGIEAVITREPGGTPGAEAIRRLVTEGPVDRWSPMTETLLFAAARHDHVTRLIRPALMAGRWVLSDRFADSTRVYQGLAGSLGLSLVDDLHRLVLDDLHPDLTFLLDLPVETGLARRRSSGMMNRFDHMTLEFHQQVRDGFKSLAAADANRFVIIDGSAAADRVAADVAATVAARFGIGSRAPSA